MKNIFLVAILILVIQLPSIAIEANSVSVVPVENIPEGATHYKAFVKTVKGSNLKLAKNRKRRKIIANSASLKVKTGERHSSHTANIIFYRKTKSGMQAMDTSSQELVVEGDLTCPAKKSPVCGIKYVERSCSSLGNREICFFGFDPVEKTYDNGLCGLESDGAEFLHAGKCQN